MKKIIRLTEGDLHRIVKESVNRILREDKYDKYNMPNGGWDNYAFMYDGALENAKSLEDWDKIMKARYEISKLAADDGADRHPSHKRPSRFNKYGRASRGASRYIHPERYGIENNDDAINKDLEMDVKSGIELNGFPS